MASKGRWSPQWSIADRIYERKLAPRVWRLHGRWPNADEIRTLSARAIAIADRYRAMKRRASRRAT